MGTQQKGLIDTAFSFGCINMYFVYCVCAKTENVFTSGQDIY